MEEVAAVLFDFDGVLADSVQVHRVAWEKTYKHLFERPMPDYPRDVLTGKSSDEIADFLAQDAGYPDRGEMLAEHKLDLLLSGKVAPPMYPGVKQMFKRLDRHNVPYAIASNAPRRFLKNTLKVWGIKVKVYLGYNDVEHPKPAPDLYVACADKLGVTSENYHRIHVYEDSAPGIMAAKAAGMMPIGVLTHHTEEELRSVGATRVCRSLFELVKWLDSYEK